MDNTRTVTGFFGVSDEFFSWHVSLHLTTKTRGTRRNKKRSIWSSSGPFPIAISPCSRTAELQSEAHQYIASILPASPFFVPLRVLRDFVVRFSIVVSPTLQRELPTSEETAQGFTGEGINDSVQADRLTRSAIASTRYMERTTGSSINSPSTTTRPVLSCSNAAHTLRAFSTVFASGVNAA